MGVAATNLILFQSGCNTVPDLHIDDGFMLAFVEHAFMSDLADIDRTAEDVVDRAAGKDSASGLPAGDRRPDLASDRRALKSVVQNRHILRIYI